VEGRVDEDGQEVAHVVHVTTAHGVAQRVPAPALGAARPVWICKFEKKMERVRIWWVVKAAQGDSALKRRIGRLTLARRGRVHARPPRRPRAEVQSFKKHVTEGP
jgi:hypothetical protein